MQQNIAGMVNEIVQGIVNQTGGAPPPSSSATPSGSTPTTSQAGNVRTSANVQTSQPAPQPFAFNLSGAFGHPGTRAQAATRSGQQTSPRQRGDLPFLAEFRNILQQGSVSSVFYNSFMYSCLHFISSPSIYFDGLAYLGL